MEAAANIQGSAADIGRILAERATVPGFQADAMAGIEEAGRNLAAEMEARLEAGGTPLALAFRGAAAFTGDALRAADWSRHVAFQLDFVEAGRPGAVFVELPLFYMWYETLAGGADNADLMIPERPPTELENRAGLILCRAICDAVMAVFEESAPIGRIAMNAAPAVPTAESLAKGEHLLLRYACAGQAPETALVAILPARLAESLRPAEVAQTAETRATEDPEWNGAVRRSVDRTPLVLDVIAGQWEMGLRALSQMRPGAIFKLGNGAEAVTVEAAGKPLLTAELGQASGAYMLRYTEPVKKDGGLDGEFPT
jgi:flagellar motor switch protein FliM